MSKIGKFIDTESDWWFPRTKKREEQGVTAWVGSFFYGLRNML